MFPRRVQNYINQINVEKQKIQQDEKLIKKQGKFKEKTQARELTKALRQLARETAKRQTLEAKLHQKTSEFAAILQVIPDFYFRVDADGTILDYRPGKMPNLYITQGVERGKSLRECLPIAVGDRFHEAMTQVLVTQCEVSFEYSLPLPLENGNFEARLLPLPEQQIIVLIRQNEDKVQAALLERNTKFRTIIENANNILFALTAEGIFSYVSPNWTDILGHEVREVEGKSFSLFVHPEDVPMCADYLQRVVTTGEKQDAIEYRVKHKNGSWRWHTSSSSATRDANGNVLNFVGICYDTTDRKQTEVALRESVQRERLLNRLSSQIRASLDLNYIVETAVREIRNLFQIDRCAFFWYRQNAQIPYWERVYEAKSSFLPCLLNDQGNNAEIELIGSKTLNREIIRINDVKTVSGMTREFLNDFGFTAFMSLPIHTQSGEIAAFSCGYSNGFRPWLDNEIELLQAVTDQIAIAIDQAKLYTQSRIAAQTAQDKAQQLEAALLELQQTQAQLIQTEKMSSLGQLVAGIAHEINNPVNFIYGNISHASGYIQDLLHLIELYQQHYCPPAPEIHQQIQAIDLDFLKQDLPKVLNSINMGSERIRQIVLSLRNFSRLDEDGMKPVDIHEGLDNTLLLLQNRLKAKPGHPEIQVIKEYGNLPRVVCHAGQMNQVFMNLLTNAIDALEEGVGRLVLRGAVGAASRREVWGDGETCTERSRSIEGWEDEVDAATWGRGEEVGVFSTRRCALAKPLVEKAAPVESKLPNPKGDVRNKPMPHDATCSTFGDQMTAVTPPCPIPKIRIRTSIDKNSVTIRIADNGLGMSEKVQKHLFDPFFTTKPVGKGTGMGLSISYQIVVKKHSGKLECISAPGEGAEFAIVIPLK
ncbi:MULTISPECIES: PAS domain S-box protein [Nostoc]|nr:MULTISPECIES: PAS domain S-box protein [Nostoc]